MGARGWGWKYGEMVRERGRIRDGLGEWDGGREEGWIWEQGSIYLN